MSTITAKEKPLHVDIPVRIAELKVAFSMAALTFEGASSTVNFPPSTYRERCG